VKGDTGIYELPSWIGFCSMAFMIVGFFVPPWYVGLFFISLGFAGASFLFDSLPELV